MKKEKKPLWKRILKGISCLILVLVIAVVGLCVATIVTEYNPDPEETVAHQVVVVEQEKVVTRQVTVMNPEETAARQVTVMNPEETAARQVTIMDQKEMAAHQVVVITAEEKVATIHLMVRQGLIIIAKAATGSI
jgi:hypothetical protein